MDIVVSSNFERLLFDLHGRDGLKMAEVMDSFQTGAVQLDDSVVNQAKALFSAHAVDDEQRVRRSRGYLKRQVNWSIRTQRQVLMRCK
jgi:threonine synthase